MGLTGGETWAIFCVSIIEKNEETGTDENRFADLLVRTSCLVTSLLPVKSWARPEVGRERGGDSDGEGVKGC